MALPARDAAGARRFTGERESAEASSPRHRLEGCRAAKGPRVGREVGSRDPPGGVTALAAGPRSSIPIWVRSTRRPVGRRLPPDGGGALRWRSGHQNPEADVDDDSRKGGRKNRNQDVDDPHNRRVPAEPLGDPAADAGDHLVLARSVERHDTAPFRGCIARGRDHPTMPVQGPRCPRAASPPPGARVAPQDLRILRRPRLPGGRGNFRRPPRSKGRHHMLAREVEPW